MLQGRDVNSRWPLYASVAVLGCESIVCFVAGSIEWGQQGVMVGVDSAETAEQARFAIELYAIGALNLLGSIAFALRRSGMGLVACARNAGGGFRVGADRGSAHRHRLVFLQRCPGVDLVPAVRIPKRLGTPVQSHLTKRRSQG